MSLQHESRCVRTATRLTPTPPFWLTKMALLKFNDNLEQGLCLSAVGMSLLFVILGLVALFTDNRVLMLVAALFLGLSILLTIGLLIHTGFFQKSSDE